MAEKSAERTNRSSRGAQVGRRRDPERDMSDIYSDMPYYPYKFANYADLAKIGKKYLEVFKAERDLAEAKKRFSK